MTASACLSSSASLRRYRSTAVEVRIDERCQNARALDRRVEACPRKDGPFEPEACRSDHFINIFQTPVRGRDDNSRGSGGDALQCANDASSTRHNCACGASGSDACEVCGNSCPRREDHAVPTGEPHAGAARPKTCRPRSARAARGRLGVPPMIIGGAVSRQRTDARKGSDRGTPDCAPMFHAEVARRKDLRADSRPASFSKERLARLNVASRESDSGASRSDAVDGSRRRTRHSGNECRGR
jgi:hypothetical protein